MDVFAKFISTNWKANNWVNLQRHSRLQQIVILKQDRLANQVMNLLIWRKVYRSTDSPGFCSIFGNTIDSWQGTSFIVDWYIKYALKLSYQISVNRQTKSFCQFLCISLHSSPVNKKRKNTFLTFKKPWTFPATKSWTFLRISVIL